MTSNQLAHYGVPGMRWGKRKAAPPPTTIRDFKRIQNEAQAKVNKLDMDKVIGGMGLTGYEALKHPNSKRDVYVRARNRAIRRGIFETAVINAVGNIALSRMNLNPRVMQQGRVGVAALCTMALKTAASDISQIRQAKVYTTQKDIKSEAWRGMRVIEKREAKKNAK